MASQHNKTAADIRESHYRQRLPLAIAARIPDFKRVCAAWHNRFGACLTLDKPRLNALASRLVDGEWSVDAILAAIEGYHQHVLTTPWYREPCRANPRSPVGSDAVLTLANFLACEKFESYARDGLAAQEFARRQARAAQAKADQAKADQAKSEQAQSEEALLRMYFDQLPELDQAALIDQAVAQLPLTYRNDLLARVRKGQAKADMSNRLIAAFVLLALKNELNRKDAKIAKNESAPSAQSADRKEL
jgi:hypothetical protein